MQVHHGKELATHVIPRAVRGSVARRLVKRRQRGVRAGLMSIERVIWGAEAFGLVEGNTGGGATGEPWPDPAVSKNPCTRTRLSPGPGRAPRCPRDSSCRGGRSGKVEAVRR